MRVTMISNFSGGGISRSAHAMASALALLPETDVRLLVPRGSGHAADNVRVCEILPAFGPERTIRRRAKFLAAQAYAPCQVLLDVRRDAPELVHFQDFFHLLAPAYMRRFQSTPIIISVHDVRRTKAVVSSRYDDLCVRMAYRQAEALIVHSSDQRAELLAFADLDDEKVHVIPLAVGPAADPDPQARQLIRHRLAIPKDTTLALFAGNIRDDKNLAGLLEAIALLRSPRVALVVAGADVARHRPLTDYQSLARRLGIEGQVTFLTGFMPERELRELFSAADVLMLPYTSEFSSQSDLLGRAAAARLPVMCSDAPTLAETVRRYHLGVAAAGSDPDSIAAAISEFLQPPGAGNCFGFDGFLSDHSLVRAAERTRGLYAHTVGTVDRC